ncbi:uncharacterized protein M421DRAFT_204758 [Didymella exigua CBS 183.55]|uniref:Uncharacterized protein n=1 Tax=Didymella exigua CBS 183.55 TaxID=1150837 RepID=A0A6A5S0X8_9PLEO|nr:uncharacterized protein M421DRAFT_204758 [Didymella exigua CBS 183.55]KAF1933782.1 hypothetical protein M421DRAFT_204758 [Didymella exigua CBS 183.55]
MPAVYMGAAKKRCFSTWYSGAMDAVSKAHGSGDGRDGMIWGFCSLLVFGCKESPLPAFNSAFFASLFEEVVIARCIGRPLRLFHVCASLSCMCIYVLLCPACACMCFFLHPACASMCFLLQHVHLCASFSSMCIYALPSPACACVYFLVHIRVQLCSSANPSAPPPLLAHMSQKKRLSTPKLRPTYAALGIPRDRATDFPKRPALNCRIH